MGRLYLGLYQVFWLLIFFHLGLLMMEDGTFVDGSYVYRPGSRYPAAA